MRKKGSLREGDNPEPETKERENILGFEGFPWRLKVIEDLGACSSTSFSSLYSFPSLWLLNLHLLFDLIFEHGFDVYFRLCYGFENFDV